MIPEKKWRLLPEDTFLGWTPYVWLVYLPTLFLTPFIRQDSTPVWVATGVVCAVFLPLYFRAHWARGKELLIIIAAIALLGLLLAPFNYSAFALFIYASSFAGNVRPTRVALMLIASLSVLVTIEATLAGLPFLAWGWAVMFVWIVGGVNTHYATVRRSDVILRRAREEIEHLATVAERERIARDLHDVLGHTLSLITLKAALASRLADRDPARAAEEIRDVERISREALSEVRAAVAGYRDAGLARETSNVRTMLQAAGIEATVDIQPVAVAASEEAVLSLTLREAVTNVVRHSRASACTMILSDDGKATRLEVIDNGTWKRGPDGNGLGGMRERIEAIGGSLIISHERGTRLVVELPHPETQSLQASVQQRLHVVA